MNKNQGNTSITEFRALSAITALVSSSKVDFET
jgi:hypothetical protein